MSSVCADGCYNPGLSCPTPSAVSEADEPDAESPLRSLLAGLERARKLTLWTLAALAAGTVLGWARAESLFRFLARPLTDELLRQGRDPRLGFTGLADPFVLYFTIALVLGIIVATPVLTAQVWLILAPRVRRRRVIAATAFVLTATGLFLGGLTFCYVVMLPLAVRYLLQLGGSFETAITVRDFLSFTLRLMLGLGLAAELPLLTLTASRFGLVTAGTLLRWFPYAVLGAFVVGAWLSPPDLLSQFLVAVPLLGLYLVGVAVAAVAGKRRRE